jgi:hypothetical protein
VLVVEATGIRDIASGPLLRIGDDRFIPGLRTLVETVRERSHGRTRLFIQILDFVAVRRRPEPRRFSSAAIWRSPMRCARRSPCGSTTRAGATPRKMTCAHSWRAPIA